MPGNSDEAYAGRNRLRRVIETDEARTADEIGRNRMQAGLTNPRRPEAGSLLGPLADDFPLPQIFKDPEEIANLFSTIPASNNWATKASWMIPRIGDDGRMTPVLRSLLGRKLPHPGMNAIVPAAVGAGTLDLIDNMSEE